MRPHRSLSTVILLPAVTAGVSRAETAGPYALDSWFRAPQYAGCGGDFFDLDLPCDAVDNVANDWGDTQNFAWILLSGVPPAEGGAVRGVGGLQDASRRPSDGDRRRPAPGCGRQAVRPVPARRSPPPSRDLVKRAMTGVTEDDEVLRVVRPPSGHRHPVVDLQVVRRSAPARGAAVSVARQHPAAHGGRDGGAPPSLLVHHVGVAEERLQRDGVDGVLVASATRLCLPAGGTDADHDLMPGPPRGPRRGIGLTAHGPGRGRLVRVRAHHQRLDRGQDEGGSIAPMSPLPQCLERPLKPGPLHGTQAEGERGHDLDGLASARRVGRRRLLRM